MGWALFPAYLVALLLQAILFQFGGLVVLGVNTTAMALPGVLAGLVGRWLLARKISPMTAGFVAGAGGVLGAVVAVAAALVFRGEAFRASATLLMAAHLPVMLIEGVVTGFIVSLIAKTAPQFLGVERS